MARAYNLLHDVVHHVCVIDLSARRGSWLTLLNDVDCFPKVTLCSAHKHPAQLMFTIFPDQYIGIERGVWIVLLWCS